MEVYVNDIVLIGDSDAKTLSAMALLQQQFVTKELD